MQYAFIFIGRSGCGKGTQVDHLREYLAEKNIGETLHIETGVEFREFITGTGPTNIHSKAVYESDERQPDFLACYMWTHVMIRDYKQGMHAIFDGTPRSLSEAMVLETALKFYKFDKAFVINLDVSRAWSEKHLLARGRSDDANMDKITKRLNWFDTDVVLAVNYFAGNSFFTTLTIAGEQTIPEVHAEIVKGLGI